MTLAELSAATSISVSTLSRLEAGQRRRTSSCCCRWPAPTGVPLDELIGPAATDDPRIHATPFIRNG